MGFIYINSLDKYLQQIGYTENILNIPGSKDAAFKLTNYKAAFDDIETVIKNKKLSYIAKKTSKLIEIYNIEKKEMFEICLQILNIYNDYEFWDNDRLKKGGLHNFSNFVVKPKPKSSPINIINNLLLTEYLNSLNMD